jgi:pimeloyl-ACP methyl ester carboxylesterase
VRKLLGTHPELSEPDGKIDPAKRVAIGQFLKDAGWLLLARQEIETLDKEYKGEMPKDAKAAFDKLKKDVDAATAELVVREAELALGAGRYKFAAEVLAAFPEKLADPKEVDRATKLMAQLKTVRERYETGRRLLRAVIDEAVGTPDPFVAAGGGPAVAAWRKKGTDSAAAQLAAAAEVVLAELHPDSAERVEFFVNLAAQVERERAAGKGPTKRPDELLATAVSAWAKGKNGATPQPASALRIWAGREMLLGYQASNDLNTRNNYVAAYKKGDPLPIDELAQVVSLLPPADPEDLANRAGTPVNASRNVPDAYRRRAPQTTAHPHGIEYLIKLPPEYHHGRSYPVVVAVTHAGNDPDQIVGALGQEADRHGYIVVAPVWRKGLDATPATLTGSDHPFVTHVLRDVVRHFTVDNDRVFLVGAGEGATMVMDVGMSHPDLFAGVIPVGPPNPKWANLFGVYWTNAQKLPYFAVTGEMARESFNELRRLYEKWTQYGFPSLLTVYKGRGIEWYAAEVPTLFDWMSRKRRANGAAVLRLDSNPTQLAWHTMRETDNRFYWVGIDRVAPQHLQANHKPGVPAVPAKVTADIRGSNQIVLGTIGVRGLTVWLSRDMIDWTRPVKVALNGVTPPGWTRGKTLEPDLGVLLEDYRERGDRRMLYMGKFELQSGN